MKKLYIISGGDNVATCPNCGSIVMEGDPYCEHCGTTFEWDDDEYDDEDDDYY